MFYLSRLRLALASLALALLSACGGGTDLSTGIAPATKSANFGQAASPEAVQAASQQLASYFNGQHANNPQALMGAQQGTQAAANTSPGTKLHAAAASARQDIFRFYNTVTQVHFFTMSTSERDFVLTNLPSFTNEGIGFFAYPAADPAHTPALSPVYRFYNHVTGGHFYTINPVEKDHVIATWPTMFNYEGIAWYASTASAPNLIPIYRFFNTKTGAHFYTSSASERDHVLATWNWFTFEGIAYYVGETATDPVVVPPIVPDTTAPDIIMLGANPLTLTAGTAYTEPGASCTDNKDPTCTVVITGTVNTAVAGTYTITYTATDAAGNISSSTRTVNVAACAAAAINPAEAYSLVFKGCSVANVAEYYAKDECVRQNSTGLIWQGQTAAGTGLRANNQFKTNFDSTSALQYFDIFAGFRTPTQAEVDASTNSIGYKNAVNASNLCGSGAWRLPTKDELAGIVKINAAAPKIDTDWFPNSTSNAFWSASPLVGNAGLAWNVDFNYGDVDGSYRGGALPVRLVRASQ